MGAGVHEERIRKPFIDGGVVNPMSVVDVG